MNTVYNKFERNSKTSFKQNYGDWILFSQFVYQHLSYPTIFRQMQFLQQIGCSKPPGMVSFRNTKHVRLSGTFHNTRFDKKKPCLRQIAETIRNYYAFSLVQLDNMNKCGDLQCLSTIKPFYYFHSVQEMKDGKESVLKWFKALRHTLSR